MSRAGDSAGRRGAEPGKAEGGVAQMAARLSVVTWPGWSGPAALPASPELAEHGAHWDAGRVRVLWAPDGTGPGSDGRSSGDAGLRARWGNGRAADIGHGMSARQRAGIGQVAGGREGAGQGARHGENAGLDPLRVLMLHDRLGPAGAARHLLETRDDLDRRLERIARLSRRGARADLAAAMHGLIGRCDEVGLGRLANVAGHVTDCLRRNDCTALAASLSRLHRIGRRAMSELGAASGLA